MRRWVIGCLTLALSGCSQRLDIGSQNGDASADASAVEAGNDAAADAAWDAPIVDSAVDSRVDAGSDCPPPVLWAATVNAAVGPSTKVLRYSMSARDRCDDLDVPKDDGLYALYEMQGGLFTVRERTIERLYPQSGTTQWSVNYAQDFQHLTRPSMFEVRYPESQPSLAVAFLDGFGRLAVIFFLDPETGDERDRITSESVSPSMITAVTGHPNRDDRFLAQRTSLFGLAEMKITDGAIAAQSPYLRETETFAKILRMYTHGNSISILWVTKGIRFWRGETLSAPLSNPRGPVECGNIDCFANDAAPDPNDPDLFYLACNAGDLVRLDATTGTCETAIAADDHRNFVIQSLDITPLP